MQEMNFNLDKTVVFLNLMWEMLRYNDPKYIKIDESKLAE